MQKNNLFLILKLIVGSMVFALGFDMFLAPNEINVGGLSGLSQALVTLTNFGSVGLLTALMNVPLFLIGGLRIGKKFFALSLVGAAGISVFIDLFAGIPVIPTEPLVGCLYGGVLCGLGLGIVFSTGGSTGGSDIVVRLIKKSRPHLQLGTVAIAFDAIVAILNGIVTKDTSKIFYTGIAIFISGQIVDAVVYRFDYSRVALIISTQHEPIVAAIAKELDRGATLLKGEGSYTGNPMKVVLTAVRRQQLPELKRLVAQIDPDAFVIVQEAHQVLGDGFSRYSGDSL